MEKSINLLQLTESRLEELLSAAATLGAHEALRLSGVPVKEFYSRAELSRRLGKGNIDEMMRNNLLTPHKMRGGKNLKYSLQEVLIQQTI